MCNRCDWGNANKLMIKYNDEGDLVFCKLVSRQSKIFRCSKFQ